MSKRKGLSLEEKRQKMLEIFYESRDFYLLKELEKMGPRKGVISQSVKDVIQSLVDDDMVFRDKIGTSVYFWSLPSSASQKLRREAERLQSEVDNLQQTKQRLEDGIRAAQKGREEGDERTAKLAEVEQLQQENDRLQGELEALAENDPELHEARKRAIKVARDAVNRWTENIFALQQWCNDKCTGPTDGLARLYHEIGITDDIDYVD